MAVLVLQAFAVERGTPGSRADQKAPCLRVAGRPGQIHYPLETKHGVEDIERHHRITMVGIGRRRRQPGRERTGLSNPLFQNLTVFGFLVVHNLVGIMGGVALSL